MRRRLASASAERAIGIPASDCYPPVALYLIGECAHVLRWRHKGRMVAASEVNVLRSCPDLLILEAVT